MDNSTKSSENDIVDTSDNNELKAEEAPFKKPILVGKVGNFPKKIVLKNSSTIPEIETSTVPTELNNIKSENGANNSPPSNNENNHESAPSNLYNEPTWSGIPKTESKEYMFEVLKNGSIIETFNLMSKPYWVFGRLPTCDICMQHPTISRCHAILQYREVGNELNAPGFYIYDLGSTHGTFLNKNRLKPKVYVRMQVGHILKLGCSTRSYILNGPQYDEEQESELTVTELKQKRADEIKQAEEEKLKREQEIEERKRKEEEKGVDWGLGEDAEEETDLSENPFAQTSNEELYLDDPKKALRGFFEREGFDLEYDCTERGMGQFLCKVQLPVDDEVGRPVVAEVLHKGKKKEAVVQCALEACRILDRAGVLRQATHESRKRKAKNWEENDFYDSDDDTFLDRTGTIEKKREKRMNAKIPPKAETYENLVEKEKYIASSITEVERRLHEFHTKGINNSSQNTDEDSLDSYMKELKHDKPDKHTLSKLKLELFQLKKEHANVIKLANIAKPASLPPLVPQYASAASTSRDLKSKVFPIIGKRNKTKVKLPIISSKKVVYACNDMDDEDDENDSQKESIDDKEKNHNLAEKMSFECDDKDQTEKDNLKENTDLTHRIMGTAPPDDTNKVFISCDDQVEPRENPVIENNTELASPSSSTSFSSGEEQSNLGESTTMRSLNNSITFKKFEKYITNGLSPFADKHQEKLQKILNTLKKLAANEDRMHVNIKMLAAKKRKVMKLISDLKNCEQNDKLEHRVSSELNRILYELNSVTEEKSKAIGKVKRMGNEIRNISDEINKDFSEYKKEMEANCSENENEEIDINDDKKKEKNERRNQRRQEKVQTERQRGYEEDANRDDYNMWLPPKNQRGDGRTDLNDRYGY